MFMRRTFFLLLTLISLLSMQASAQTATQATTNASSGGNAVNSGSVDTERIIRAFTAKETQFRKAFGDYSFKRDAVVQTIGQGGQISGEYHRVSTFIIDEKGNRFEKINFFPLSTLTELTITPEDLEDLSGVQTVALETSKIDLYNFSYVGKEKIDELNLYVFDVSPKVIPDPKKTKERFFKGRIWIDDQDLQIVKIKGKGIPEPNDQRFPTFETYREQIDGKYWFPTYTYADEDLVFKGGNVIHIRMRVKFSDFVRGRSEVRVLEDNGEPIKEVPETNAPEKPKQ
jgi:outer membrane lipoprotein-sorting protein